MKRTSIVAACVLSAGVEAADFTLTWNRYDQPFGHNIVAYCGVNNATAYEITSVAATETRARFALAVNRGDAVQCYARALRLSDLTYSAPTPSIRYTASAAVVTAPAPTNTPSPTTSPTTTPTTSSGSTTPAPTAGTTPSGTSGTTSPTTSPGTTTVVVSNTPPVISGTPPTRVAYGEAYSFRVTASDADGDALYFNIANKPVWAEFDSATGELRGLRRMTWIGWSERPASYDVGITTGIVITVSDGKTTRSLPAFNIEVYNPNLVTATSTPTAPTTSTTTAPTTSTTPTPTTTSSTPSTPTPVAATTNGAPTISGQPATIAKVNAGYLFIPYALDPDYDTLTFSIQNLPAWAEFNTATGELRGLRRMTPVGWVRRPSTNDLGVYPNIIISVSDGRHTVALPPFSITVSY